MKRARQFAVAVCTVAVVMLVSSARAEVTTQVDVVLNVPADDATTPDNLVILRRLGRVEIPFPFSVDAGTLPAGSYTLLVEGSQGGGVILKSNSSGELTRSRIVTRLADQGGSDPRFVFDIVGDLHYLAEIHSPGTDGYALQGAPVEHTHELVSGTE